MKVIMNKSNGFYIDADIHCSPTELLIILRALRLMVSNSNVNTDDRKKATEMRRTILSFCEREEE